MVPFISLMVWLAYLIMNNGPTYRCLFPEQPDAASIPSCAEAGVIGVLPGIIGCWQALEAIKIITKIGEPSFWESSSYNALSQSTRIVTLQAIEENLLIDKLPDPIENCSSYILQAYEQHN